MLELLGYLICGLLIGTASVISGRMRLQQAAMIVGTGLIGVLGLSLMPYLNTPTDQLRAALAGQGLIAFWFFLALLAAFAYLCLQVLDQATPENLLPGLRRWENLSVAFGGLMMILALATTKLTLAA